MLSPKERLRIITRIRAAVLKHHFSVGNLDLRAWSTELDAQTPGLLEALDDDGFEDRIQQLLSQLKSSHTDFFRQQRGPIRPEHAIGATLRRVTLLDKNYWMFLDVFEDGPAARAGLTPGSLLIAANGELAIPPSAPTFGFGKKQTLAIGSADKAEVKEIEVVVPDRKSTRPRLPFVEPKSLAYRMLSERVGLIKIAFFSGLIGIRFSTILDFAINSLKAQGCDRLIIDLRGCLGGSLGFARLASYMTLDQIPIGYDITRKRQREGYDPRELPRIRMPQTRLGALLRLVQFSVRDKSLVLLTQGIGEQPFHGHIVILINEFTSSAAEMVAQFAKDAKLATLVGTRTAGLVLGSTLFDVGNSYALYLPVFGWYTPTGSYIEGSGVMPDIEVDVDAISLAAGNDAQLKRALDILH